MSNSNNRYTIAATDRSNFARVEERFRVTFDNAAVGIVNAGLMAAF